MTTGFQGWGDVVHSIIFKTSNDITIIMLCATVVVLKRLFRLDRIFSLRPAFARKTNAEN
jgi:hypothetical protein